MGAVMAADSFLKDRMMHRIARALMVSLLLLAPGVATPLGLGNVEVSSALNEPLDAGIPLSGLQTGDTDGMRVSLGSAEQFKRAGIDRPFLLSLLRFEVEAGAGGVGRIRITTREPVAEPFLNFLIEVDWPRGRVVREYTLLLDPPVYGAAISSTVREAVSTIPAAPPIAAAPASEPAAQAAESTTPQPTSTPPAAAPMTTAGHYGPVTATDTLWSLAARLRPDAGVSVQRMMLALLEANPEAFTIRNVNALRAGATLRVPEAAEIGADERAAAPAAVRRPHAAWGAYRRGRAAAAGPAASGSGPAARRSGRRASTGAGAARARTAGAPRGSVVGRASVSAREPGLSPSRASSPRRASSAA